MAMRVHSVQYRDSAWAPRPLTQNELEAFLAGRGLPRTSQVCVDPVDARVKFHSGNIEVSGCGCFINIVLARVCRRLDPVSGRSLLVLQTPPPVLKPVPPASAAKAKPLAPGPPPDAPAGDEILEKKSDGVLPPVAAKNGRAPPAIRNSATKAFRREWILEVDAAEGEEAEAVVSAALRQLGKCGAVVEEAAAELRLVENIGSGAFAEVFTAELGDAEGEMRGSWVAAKLFKQKSGDGEASKAEEALRREVTTLVAAQGHPNVLRLSGLRAWEDATFQELSGVCLVSELCSEDLATHLECRGRPGLSEAKGRELMRDLFAALEHIHGCGIVHRDVKLGNILIREDRSLVLADFGLACFVTDASQRLRSCGTPGYLAPELILKQPCCYESDMFSAGVVMYVLLSGKMPFRAKDVQLVLRKTLQNEVRFNHPAFDGVGDACKLLMMNLMEKAPSLRLRAGAAQMCDWMISNEGNASPAAFTRSTTIGSDFLPASDANGFGSEHSSNAQRSRWAFRRLPPLDPQPQEPQAQEPQPQKPHPQEPQPRKPQPHERQPRERQQPQDLMADTSSLARPAEAMVRAHTTQTPRTTQMRAPVPPDAPAPTGGHNRRWMVKRAVCHRIPLDMLPNTPSEQSVASNAVFSAEAPAMSS